MSSNPDRPSETGFQPKAEIIPAISWRWILQWITLMVALFSVFWLTFYTIGTHEFRRPNAGLPLHLWLSFLVPPLLGMIISLFEVRRLERQMRYLPERPGGMPPDQTIALKMGLGSRGFPLNSGALILTPQELVFYRRRFRRWAEEMRIPLGQIATVETRKTLPHSKLVLVFKNGGRLKFRTLDANRWRSAILETTKSQYGTQDFPCAEISF